MIRFKCAVCRDFDFCEKCFAEHEGEGESTMVGEHPTKHHSFWQYLSNQRMNEK